jgi:hypothetical protein
MTKALTSTLLALSLTVTSIGATPAFATHDRPAASKSTSGNSELGGLIAGAITLFILGSAIENSKKQKAKASASARATARAEEKALAAERERARKNLRKHKRYVPYPEKPKGTKKASRQHYRLPADCQFSVRTRDGRRDVFGKYCLEEFARQPRLLPKRCEETVKIRHGRRADVYDTQCMIDRGYRVEARHR